MENHTEEMGSKAPIVISIISGIMTIVDTSVRYIKNASEIISPLGIIGILISCVSLIIYFIIEDEKTNYKIKKWIKYYFPKKDSYSIEKKTATYTYKTRTEMEYTKEHTIKSNVSRLNTFVDKFKWSKEQKVEDINIVSNNNDKISVKRVENWHQYTVNFEGIGKGQKKDISITIKDLNDPDKEALPFLSSNVVVKTKELKLIVRFEDDKLVPINAYYKIFDNYANEFPLFKVKLDYNSTEHKLEKTERMPIYGYRYVITWDFQEDGN